MQAYEKRPIGNTSLPVSILGFGGAPVGNLYRELDPSEALATVRAAIEQGIGYFDTAPLYGYGLSEHRIGEALRSIDRDRYVLSTKVGRLLTPAADGRPDEGQFPGCLPFEGRYDYSYDGVMRSFEDSLQRIGTHRIDILLIHDVDVWTHGSEEAMQRRFREVMDGGYRALELLRSQGEIKAIGAGVNEWRVCEQFASAGDFDCFLLAGRYTLLEQEALDSFLPLCQEKNIAVVIGGPYNTGILATGAVDGAYYNYAEAPDDVVHRVRQVEQLCTEHGISLPSAALQFPLHHPSVVSVIPGARSIVEVSRNADLLASPIPAAFWSDMKTAGLLRADAPVAIGH